MVIWLMKWALLIKNKYIIYKHTRILYKRQNILPKTASSYGMVCLKVSTVHIYKTIYLFLLFLLFFDNCPLLSTTVHYCPLLSTTVHYPNIQTRITLITFLWDGEGGEKESKKEPQRHPHPPYTTNYDLWVVCSHFLVP